MAKSSSICREQITLGDNALAQTLYGQNNVHLKLIERQLGLSLHARGNELTMIGTADAVERAHRLMQELGLGFAWDEAGDPIVNSGPDSMVGHAIPSDKVHLTEGHVFHIDLYLSS